MANDRSTAKSSISSSNNPSKKRKKENSASDKVKKTNAVEEPKGCHQCKKVKDRVVECTKCHSKRYCVACITKWYPHVSEEEFVKACPVCCNYCNCKACLRRFSSPKHMQQGGYTCSEPNKVKYSKQILHKVFPLVATLNEHQLMEKEIEANVKGVTISDLQLQDADCEVDDDIFCDNCGAYSFDFYRSCACGYDLCLLCCRELRDGQLKRMTIGWKARIDGSIPCPPKEIGGCNDGTLELKRILSVNWIVNLLEKAQRVYKFNNSYDSPQTCMESSASFLYSLSAKDIQPQHMQHFQSHWSEGEPIIVNDVLSTSSGLSWEPMVLWRAFRDITKSGSHSHAYEVKAINCLDWSEVTIDLSKFTRGYSEARVQKQGSPLILKLEDWKPSCLSQGEWPRHFVELINHLPFKDYTNPHNGYLNVATKLPDLSSKPDMGPKMDIAYGDSVTKLHYEKSDTVNVLTHAKSGVITSTKLNKTKKVKEKHGDAMEGIALWDVFHRQDVAKLEEYLRNHTAEFRHTDCLSVEQVILHNCKIPSKLLSLVIITNIDDTDLGPEDMRVQHMRSFNHRNWSLIFSVLSPLHVFRSALLSMQPCWVNHCIYVLEVTK
ncbi:putative transcription factor C2H2 family [Helianthus annuus]|nr:putative transcription factor C2H2 family [Helianthus annuus]